MAGGGKPLPRIDEESRTVLDPEGLAEEEAEQETESS